MKILIFDTETTGLLLPTVAPIESQPKIIELGVVVIKDGEKTGEYNWLINPGEQITDEIAKITGITNDSLSDKLTFKQILEEIEEVFFASDIGIAHNAPFDVGMLKSEIERSGRTNFPWPKEIICSVAEYSHLFGKRPKLTQLYEKIVGRPLAQSHRALDDALALYEILDKSGMIKDLSCEKSGHMN